MFVKYIAKDKGIIKRIIATFNSVPVHKEPYHTGKQDYELGKLAYDYFLEHSKQEFPIGCYVKFDNQKPLVMPEQALEVFGYNELWYSVKYDQLKKEPTCITVKTTMGNFFTVSPSSIRLLTLEELDFAKLSHKQSAENA